MVARGPATTPPTIRLLDYEPELGASLRPERRAEARAWATATAVVVQRGVRTRAEVTAGIDGAYGVLVLEGLANRTVVLDGVASAQLVGPGDLIRADDDARGALVPTKVLWNVLEPLSVALLDERFLLTVRRWPEIVATLFERVAAQEARREVHRALCQLPRVEDRVHGLLWLLAERWGRMTKQGVVLRLRLTHELLGQLVGAKRPTVSLALKQLGACGSVHRRADGSWLLTQAWTALPSAADTALDGATVVDLSTPFAPARSHATSPSAARPAAAASYAEVRARIERLRRVHERARVEVAVALSRSAVARERSRSLRRSLD